MPEEGERRHSRALEPELIKDPIKKAEAEATNGLRQYDVAVAMVQDAIDDQKPPFRLKPSAVLALQREALRGISAYAGNWRPADVEISFSQHEPPGAHLVPELVEDMCEYVNQHWPEDGNSTHLAAYVMWRLNWIHPFADGNGRTSRALSFVVLFSKLGSVLPGTPTLPDLVIDHRSEYEAALDEADAAWKQGRIDVSRMERLIESLLAMQLTKVYEIATGKKLVSGS